jgi:hypothetical protein
MHIGPVDVLSSPLVEVCKPRLLFEYIPINYGE